MSPAKQEEPIRLLHLSDVHFAAGKAWDADPLLRSLIRFLGEESAGGLAPDLVVLTGDVAFAGKAEEYDLALAWLKEQLWPSLAPGLPRDRLLLVPGNHDVDRGKISEGAESIQRELLASRSQEDIAKVLQDDDRHVLLKRHADYLDFLHAWYGAPAALPWWQRIVQIRGSRLHVSGLDSAFMASGDDDRGRLLLGRYQLHETIVHRDAEDGDWRIALLHHPWDYLAEFDAQEVRTTIHRHCDLVLRGHLHSPLTERILPPDRARSCLELAAGCVYETSLYPNAFQWIELYRTPRRVRVMYRAWLHGAWTIDRNQPGCPKGCAEYKLTNARAPRATGVLQPMSIRQPRTLPSLSVPRQGRAAPKKPRKLSPTIDGTCEVLLLYVNNKERDALIETFSGNGKIPPRPRTICDLPCLDLGEVGGRRLFATATNMGSATPGGSASLTVDAITKLEPKWIIAVGVAFGMDPEKVPLGTVLVSDRVSCYEPQRLGRKSIRRGVSVAVQPHLKQHFEIVSSPAYWSASAVCFGEILSGEKLIDDPTFKKKLRKAYPEAIGGEMEAAGIYSAALLKGCDWIVVKGVCDYADGHKAEDKDALQTRAAINAARFVRHVLTAYQADRVIDDSTQPHSGHSSASPEKRGTPSIRRSIHSDAIDAIARCLDIVPVFCRALAERSGLDSSKGRSIADWLCAPDGKVGEVMESFVAALEAARRTTRDSGELSRIADRARDILGWLVVTTVLEGYETEDAPLAQRWKEGSTFRFPITRGPCIEVLLARWRNGKAEFNIEPSRYDYGKDEITPRNLGELGFGEGLKPDPSLAVNLALRTAYQNIHKVVAPETMTESKIKSLKNWLEIRRRKDQPYRLVLDRGELDDALNLESYVRAIADALPELYVILIDSRATPTEEVFVIPESELNAHIYYCLDAIEHYE